MINAVRLDRCKSIKTIVVACRTVGDDDVELGLSSPLGSMAPLKIGVVLYKDRMPVNVQVHVVFIEEVFKRNLAIRADRARRRQVPSAVAESAIQGVTVRLTAAKSAASQSICWLSLPEGPPYSDCPRPGRRGHCPGRFRYRCG